MNSHETVIFVNFCQPKLFSMEFSVDSQMRIHTAAAFGVGSDPAGGIVNSRLFLSRGLGLGLGYRKMRFTSLSLPRVRVRVRVRVNVRV